MSLSGALAALLLDGPAHGYQLKAILEAELGPLWSAKASQVYLVLGRMERDGLLTRRRIHQETRPDRQLLKLTPKGRHVGMSWLLEGGSSEEIVVRLAVARVALPSRLPEIAAAIRDERMSTLKELRALRTGSSQGFQREAVDAEIGHVSSDLRWIASIEEGASELVARERAVKRPLIRLAHHA
jgi:DNA-binding PadR family transcriptional regulator